MMIGAESVERARRALAGHRVCGVHLVTDALVIDVRRQDDEAEHAAVVSIPWPWRVATMPITGVLHVEAVRDPGVSTVFEASFWRTQYDREAAAHALTLAQLDALLQRGR